MQKNQGGPWGGSGGDMWSYQPQNGITEIHIFHGEFINSIMFVDGLGECSPKFGATGGNQSVKIKIDHPSEYLTGISGVHDILPHISLPRVVKSLQFHTNTTKYGPYGSYEGKGTSFVFKNAKEYHITGFHGRSGTYLDAIGVYTKFGSLVHVARPVKRTEEFDSIVEDVAPRDPGPWGGTGKLWDDGVFAAVKKINVHIGKSTNVICAVQFEYLNTNGKSITSPKYGGKGDCTVKQINIDHETDFLIGVSGFYGQMEHGGVNVIKSLRFYTNKGMYGPFGEEKGTYFTSLSCRGKILGFRGSSDEYLNAIGVHVQYF
ncbi:hypothetical protein ACJIZ3_002644 [Penstemon smallii]|uniref:Jacalin-type lectin domain-containing protein n=1 Tax=Penstemon smallii TaxID=265156 RepID=A0ABD3U731_9LAMI